MSLSSLAGLAGLSLAVLALAGGCRSVPKPLNDDRDNVSTGTSSDEFLILDELADDWWSGEVPYKDAIDFSTPGRQGRRGGRRGHP